MSVADTTDPEPAAAAEEPDDGADTAAAGEAAAAEQPGGGETVPTAPGWRRYAGIGLVAAVYAGAFGLAGGLGAMLWDQHVVARAGQIAAQTAVAYATVLTSINSDEVDDNFAAVLNGATGDFKDMYTKSSVQLRQLLIDNKSTSEGSAVESAVQSESKDEVVVLLMVDQKVTNSELPDPRVDRLRMKITMDRVDGRWLASKVELP